MSWHFPKLTLLPLSFAYPYQLFSNPYRQLQSPFESHKPCAGKSVFALMIHSLDKLSSKDVSGALASQSTGHSSFHQAGSINPQVTNQTLRNNICEFPLISSAKLPIICKKYMQSSNPIFRYKTPQISKKHLGARLSKVLTWLVVDSNPSARALVGFKFNQLL